MLPSRYPMALLLLLPVVVLLTPAAASKSEADLDPVAMNDMMKKLAKEALGKDKMQELIDGQRTKFDTQKIMGTGKGETFAKELADKLSERLKVRLEAVEKIKKAVEKEYNNFPTRDNYADTKHPRCCEIDQNLLEYNSKLGKKVDTNSICYRVSRDTNGNYQIPVNAEIYRVMRENYDNTDSLKWQYFGDESGVHVTFPTRYTDCHSYDPRFRPWYVETATPVSKDLVLVIDVSWSMNDHNRLAIAKEAAKTVVKTLNPNDRIGIVRFHDDAATPPGPPATPCYSHQLAFAIKDNLDYLESYIERLSAHGSTNYIDAIEKAFDLIENTKDLDEEAEAKAGRKGETRDKAILFLTDGKPSTGSPESILQTIADRNRKLQNSVVFMTYGLGKELEEEGGELLTNMAAQIRSNSSYGDINKGEYTNVTSVDDLRYQLGSYYNQFSDQILNHPIATVPYMDFSGLGLVTSICEPVHHGGKLVGVACVDVRMEDILGDIAYYQHGQFAYSFVIDGTGRTFIHPLLPSPFNSGSDAVFLDISGLERAEGTQSILESMKSGGSGSKQLKSSFYQGNGNVTKQGVTKFELEATFQWQHVTGTNFSVCLVFSEKDEEVNVTVEGEAEHFLFYRFDLISPADPCNNLKKVATTEMSSVKLTPHAYSDHFRSFYDAFTVDDLERMTQYMTTPGFIYKKLKRGVKDTVVITEQMDDFWKGHNEEYGKYVIWRYVATFNGVFRLYPGAALPHGYVHFNRPWYDEAMANKGQTVMSVPYTDAFGAGVIVTIAHTILERNEDHNLEEDMTIGVIGMDLKLDYIDGMVKKVCKPTVEQQCFLVDNAGFLIYHPDFMEDGAEVQDIHITKHEPDIATYLIEKGYMKRKTCIGLGDKRIYHTWKLEMDLEKGSVDTQTLLLNKIPKTNLFIGVKKVQPFANDCDCPTKGVSKCSESQPTHCECPCYTGANYEYCTNTFDIKEEEKQSTCTAPKPPTDSTTPLQDEEKTAAEYSLCFDINCNDYSSESFCKSVAHCIWCDGDTSGVAKCQDLAKCEDGDGVKGVSSAIIGGAVGGAVALILIIVIIVVVVVRKRRNDNTGAGTSYLGAPIHQLNDSSSSMFGSQDSYASGQSPPSLVPSYGQPLPAKPIDQMVRYEQSPSAASHVVPQPGHVDPRYDNSRTQSGEYSNLDSLDHPNDGGYITTAQVPTPGGLMNTV